MRVITTIAISLAILPVALLAAHLGAEFLAIDGCLDAGRVYDHRQGVCRADIEHLPPVAFVERHGRLVAAAVGMALAGAGLAAVARRWR